MAETPAVDRSRRRWAAAAGPLVIVAGVVLVLWRILFLGRLTDGDITTFFVPNWCLLGSSLRAGHVLAWNPYTLGGTPFAADPQSGWMYLAPMAIFTALPCGVAIRAFMALLPIVAGLGVYAFLRIEGVGRPAATVGGLTLALGIAGSELVTSWPFAGALAWTALALAGAAKLVRSPRWSGRLGWSAAVALLWGEVAGAHLSIGLVIGTLALAAYLVVAIARNLRERSWTAGETLGVLVALVVGALVLNAGFLLPRVHGLGQTDLSLGYGGLQALERSLRGLPPVPRELGPAAGAIWPLDLGTAPSLHLAAVALGLTFAGWWGRGRRLLVGVFTALGLVSWLASIRPVADWVLANGGGSRLTDFYLRRPDWMGYGLILALAVLAGLGVEAFLRATSARERVAMVVPGAALWGVLPLALGAGLVMWLFVVGAVAGGVALWVVARRPAFAAAVPAVVALELVVNAFLGYRPQAFAPAPALAVRLPTPTVRIDRLVSPSPVERALEGRTGRVLAQDLGGWRRLQADPRSMLFRYQEVQGYNPVELLRYWTFVRALSPERLDHNLSIVHNPPEVLRDLLQVRYVIAPSPPFPGLRGPLVTAPDRSLFEAAPAPPPASVIGAWRVVNGADAALAAVRALGFDPAAEVVLERLPGIVGSGGIGSAGRATVTPEGTQASTIRVQADRPGVVLVRVPLAAGWHATLDGRPVPILAADYVDQAVAVPAGRHTIRLAYDDPSIGIGVLVAVAGAVGWAALAVLLRRRERSHLAQEDRGSLIRR